MVREFPVFVPSGKEHLAAVVTMPDRDPRGLLLLTTGLGAPRSHRYQVWAVAADRLAAAGIASVRFDYPGLHDSTGSAERIHTAELPWKEAIDVAAFARKATGADEVIAVGNCWGAQLAVIVLAEMNECIGAVGILPETGEPGRMNTAMRRAAGRGVLRSIRGSRVIRRLARPLRRFDVRPAAALREPLRQALSRGRVLFLYDQEHLETGPHAIGRIRPLVDRLPAGQRNRFEVRVLPGVGLARFGSVGVQETLIETLLEWAERTFGEGKRGETMEISLSTVGDRAPGEPP